MEHNFKYYRDLADNNNLGMIATNCSGIGNGTIWYKQLSCGIYECAKVVD